MANKKYKKHKGSTPPKHKPDGDWLTPLRDSKSKFVIKSGVLQVHLEKRWYDAAKQYAQYKVMIDNKVHLLDIELSVSNTGVSMLTTAAEDMQAKPVKQDFPYTSCCVLELYDVNKNLLFSREAERVCRAIRAGGVESTLVVKDGSQIETHFTYQDKEYITYSDLYFNPKRDFVCIYVDIETFAELALFHLSDKALKDIATRIRKTRAKPNSMELELIESILACKHRQYITIKDLDYNDLVEGEAEYVAQILRTGKETVIDESELSDEFGSIQKLTLCGDKLCFIGAETTFNPCEMFCFDCADAKDGEIYTVLIS